MKKIFLIFYLFLVVILPVQAKEYSLNTLIPVDEVATVHTDNFDYTDFVFSSQFDESGNYLIYFQSIHNNTLSKKPVSINILLFDNQQKNIGYLTYCSNKDFTSNYSGFQLKGGESSPFTIIVSTKYFGESGKTSEDVSFFAVQDENAYCQVGGYDKYLDKTIDEILNPIEEKFYSFSNIFEFLSQYLKREIIFLALIVFFSLMIFLMLGSLFNALHNKMYGRNSTLCFLPIFNIYISIKEVFGKIIALIFMFLLFLSGVLYYFDIRILLYIMGGLWIVSVFLVVIKLITKNYNFLYLEPSISLPSISSKKEEEIVEDRHEVLDLNYNVSSGVEESSGSNISEGGLKDIVNSSGDVKNDFEDNFEDDFQDDFEDDFEDDF